MLKFILYDEFFQKFITKTSVLQNIQTSIVVVVLRLGKNI